MNQTLDQLWKKGCDFLGVEHAILGGAMTWVSNSDLVAAISNAGGFGVLASGSMPPDILRAEIEVTKEKTDKPFGVNLILMHPQLDEMAEVCIKTGMTHVVMAGGIPSKTLIQKLKDGGCKTIGFAPSHIIARKLQRSNIDALIIEGHEAGGHIGPVATSVLVQEILPHVNDIPVFVAGGIGRGETIVSYLKLGASGVQLGTVFACSTESPAHPDFKKAFFKASARDAIVTKQLDDRFPVIPVRALSNKGTDEFHKYQREMIDSYEKGDISLEDAQQKIEYFWAGSLRKAVQDGDIENGSLMAGQSVGLVKDEKPVQDIINQLNEQAISQL